MLSPSLLHNRSQIDILYQTDCLKILLRLSNDLKAFGYKWDLKGLAKSKRSNTCIEMSASYSITIRWRSHIHFGKSNYPRRELLAGI